MEESYASSQPLDIASAEAIIQTIEVESDSMESSSTESKSQSDIFPYQTQVAKVYDSRGCQTLVAFLIAANFICFMIEAEIDPLGEVEEYRRVWRILVYVYNISFTIELAVNMYGHWLVPFWSDGWNIFDIVIVAIGLMEIGNFDVGALAMLRTIRAFRVFRLFKRIKSLRTIVASIVHAVPGVVNTFVILLLFPRLPHGL